MIDEIAHSAQQLCIQGRNDISVRGGCRSCWSYLEADTMVSYFQGAGTLRKGGNYSCQQTFLHFVHSMVPYFLWYNCFHGWCCEKDRHEIQGSTAEYETRSNEWWWHQLNCWKGPWKYDKGGTTAFPIWRTASSSNMETCLCYQSGLSLD